MSNFADMFGPYSPETKGDLREYLKTHDGFDTDNSFHGPEYFFIIKDAGLMMPGASFVRVDRNPVPDLGYIVNSKYMLESGGPGDMNMSLIGAEKGIYDPNEVLKDQIWSISHLNLLED